MSVTMIELPIIKENSDDLTTEQRQFYLDLRQADLARAAATATYLKLPDKHCPHCKGKIKLSLADSGIRE